MSEKIQGAAQPTAKKRGGAKKKWLIFGGILLLVLLVLVWVLLSESTLLDGLKRAIRYGNKDSDYGAVSFDVYGTCCYGITNNGLTVLTQAGATLFAEDGTTLGRLQRALDKPALRTQEDAFALYDIGGNRYAVMGSDGELLFEGETQGKLFDFDLSAKGYSAVLSSGAEGGSVLEIFDENAALLYRRNSQAQILNCCAVSEDGGYAVAAAMGQADISFLSTAQIYRTTEEETRAQLALGEQVIYDMSFIAEDIVCAVGENSLCFFDTDGDMRGQYDLSGSALAFYSFGGDGFVTILLETYRANERYRLITLDTNGEVHASLTLSDAQLHISACGGYVMALSAQEFSVYNSDLELQHAGENTEGYLQGYVRDDGTAMLVGSGEAKLYIP
ncbi:MAG: DUF5711 family protein [Oscillospiraceae bacterium]|jgi:hypothetical protein|nr:DUF5711 family protein [Oscillospiraceae bacterium]